MTKLTDRPELDLLRPWLQPDPTATPPDLATLNPGDFAASGQARTAAHLLRSGMTAPAVLAACPGVAEALARGDGAGPGVRIWTDAELLAADFPEPVWIVPDLIPAGLALLAGRPKQGKSFMALQLSMALASGGRFLGRTVPQGRALYIALEDSDRRMQQRRRAMGGPDIGGLSEAFLWPAINEPDGLDLLRATIRKDRLQLVVIDTLARAIRGRFDWNDVGQVTPMMAELQAIAGELNMCLLLIDHHRKNTGIDSDVVADVMGSTGKAAVADTIMGLYRRRGEKGAVLSVTGRDIGEESIEVLFDPLTCCWQVVDGAGIVTEAQDGIIGALQALGGKASTKQLAAHLGRDSGNVSRELGDLADRGAVLRGERQGREVLYVLPARPTLL